MEAREQKAQKTVRNYMWWSMGAGLIPFPIVDLAAVSGVQLKMLSTLTKQYDISFSENKGKSFVSALLGFLVPNTLSHGSVGSLIKSIPVVGHAMGMVTMPVFCGAATHAIGKVFIQHFESGGTFLDFNPSEVKEYFKQQFEEGEKVVKDMSKGEKDKAEG